MSLLLQIIGKVKLHDILYMVIISIDLPIKYLTKFFAKWREEKMFKKTTAIMLLMVLFVFATGCSTEKNQLIENMDDELEDYSENFIDDFQVDNGIKDLVVEEILDIYKMHIRDYPNYGYSDWRIIKLESVYEYDNLEGLNIDVYRVGYELLSDKPENVILAGGMYMTEDNWVCPTYPNSTYFIFESETQTEEAKFLFSMMQNDSNPGDEIFTEDLIRAISNNNL